MDTKDAISILISLASVTIAAAAWRVSHVSLLKQRETQKWIVNHDLLSRADRMLIEDNGLLEIYGIDKTEVIKDGITIKELIYIYTSLNASSAFHQIGDEKVVKLTNFRKNFLKCEKVRTSWEKYLSGRMLNDNSSWALAISAEIKGQRALETLRASNKNKKEMS